MKIDLRQKILSGFGLVLLIMLIVFAVSLSSLLKLGKASDAILQQNYRSIESTYQMLDAIEQHYSLLSAAISGNEKPDHKALLDEQLKFEQWLLLEKGNITEKGEIDAVAKLEKHYKAYISNTFTLLAQGGIPGADADRLLESTLKPDLAKIKTYNQQIMQINKNGMFTASNKAKAVARTTTLTLILIGFIGILTAIILSLSLSSLIVRPLKNMLSAMEKVASGDYATRVESQSTDELGIVSNAFNHMAEKLSEYHEMNIRNILREKQINEAILLNMDDGLFLLDTDFHISNVNKSGAAFFGTDPLDSKGKHILEVIRNESLFESIKITAEQGKSPTFGEGQSIIVVGTENDRRYLQFYLTPIFEQTKRLLGVLILFQDITHLKQLDRLKSEFLMIASHELKTPLTSINMSIALLQEKTEGKLGIEEKELLQIAIDEVNRLKLLINDLLDLSKIEAGKIDLNFEDIDVESMINKITHIFQPEMQSRGIILESEIEAGTHIRGDSGKIAWILSNLLSNAQRFTPTQGKITVKAVKMGKYAQISVTDTGIGIPYEFQNKIFEKFFQVLSPQNTGGTGLGLAICKEIVRAHGGTIWVESEPNKGSTFYFTIPVI